MKEKMIDRWSVTVVRLALGDSTHIAYKLSQPVDAEDGDKLEALIALDNFVHYQMKQLNGGLPLYVEN